jgi:hypothetical protein
MDVLGGSKDQIEGESHDLERVHSIDRAIHSIGRMQGTFSFLCGLPFVHTIVVISKEGHSGSMLNRITSHGKLQVRNSEIGDDFVHKDMVCWDVSHTTELHWSRGVMELKGF